MDIFRMDDGFYVGTLLENRKKPTMAKGAYKLKGEDIMTMFTQFFTDYCQDSGKTQLLMQDADGQLFVTMKVPAKKAGEAKE